MTKKEFEKYCHNNNTVYCCSCNKTLPTTAIACSHLRKNGTVDRCRTCDWIHRHNGIPYINGLTSEQVTYTIEFILCEKSTYLNDLATSMNLSLSKVIEAVNILKIGNKHYMVKDKCKNCNKDTEDCVSAYLRNQCHLFCSQECYWEHKKQTTKCGKENTSYKRIETNCTNCGCSMEIIPAKYNITNSFGDNHNFCSRECYWEYRKKYYVKEKASRFGTHLSQKQIEEMCRRASLSRKNIERLNSGIQLKINSVLDKNNIIYKREYPIEYYSIDNFLVDSELMIEVMGDYWHTSPLKFNELKYKINQTQQRGLKHDKQKYSYIKNHFHIEILYLWETDVDKNIEMCEALILEYINNNGILPNYHSFNWTYEDKKLRLKDEIIIPYQSLNIEKYRHLFVDKKVG